MIECSKGQRLTTKLMEMVERIGMKGMDQIEPEMRIMSRATNPDIPWICNEGTLAQRVRESIATRAVMSSVHKLKGVDLSP